MILPFMTTWSKGLRKDDPTNFVEKIWTGIPIPEEDWVLDYEKMYYSKFGNPHAPEGIMPMPKIHTIRKDTKNRWHKGNNIHFYINSRQEDMFRFAPVIPCTETQRIEILHGWITPLASVYESDKEGKRRECVELLIDGETMYLGGRNYAGFSMLDFAINDGFDSIEHFFSYFNEDFKGKIIHWTDKLY